METPVTIATNFVVATPPTFREIALAAKQAEEIEALAAYEEQTEKNQKRIERTFQLAELPTNGIEWIDGIALIDGLEIAYYQYQDVKIRAVCHTCRKEHYETADHTTLAQNAGKCLAWLDNHDCPGYYERPEPPLGKQIETAATSLFHRADKMSGSDQSLAIIAATLMQLVKALEERK